jgi:DNA polymerase-1
MSKHTLLVDGDLLVYRIAAANEEATEWENDVWTLHSDARACCEQFDGEIRKLVEDLEATKVIVAFSAPKATRFREKLMGSYKGNRSTRKPVAYGAIVKYVEEAYHTRCWPGLEADDVLGIMATEDCTIRLSDRLKTTEERTIVSDDKDLLTIPGQLYRDGQLMYIDENDANWQWMYQTLTGDTTDGYKGCPGVGPKGAERILSQITDLDLLWSAVVAAYHKAGFGVEEALLNARMARILRDGDYTYEGTNYDVKLWEPWS